MDIVQASRAGLRVPPLVMLAGAALVGLAVILLVTGMAVEQPWLGLGLAPVDDMGATVLRSRGPGVDIPMGTTLVSMAGGGQRAQLTPLDFTVEPDGAMGDYPTYRRFLARQDRLAGMTRAGAVTLIADSGEAYTVIPARERPLSTLPAEFWVQLAVGFFAWMIAAAVFAFRPGDTSARYLLISGAATLTFAPLAAVYSTRELALPGPLFQWLNDLNFLGGSLFTASFVALMLNYPKRIGPAWAGPIVFLAYILWFAAQQMGVFESMTLARRLLVVIGVLSTFALAGVHWYGTRRDPAARAALQWFLLSWMLGTTIFVLLILLPQLFGIDTSAFQGYAFLLFLLVYGGLAFGILRFRLFELGIWWGRIILWTLTVFLLVVMDLLFLLGLDLSSHLSLGLALVICALVWVPLRSLVWSRFLKTASKPQDALFARVIDIALAPPGNNPAGAWQALLKDVFSPLELRPAVQAQSAGVDANGLSLCVPAVGPFPAVELEYAGGGRRLFGPRDEALAGELISMLRHAIDSRSSYETGVARERERIARDMHDNVGAQLLAALHSQDGGRKDAMIRETLADLRDIINDASRLDGPFADMLADLRLESADRLSASGVTLDWQIEAGDAPALNSSQAHALRSIIREAVSNVIKHASARKMRVRLAYSGGILTLEIDDNGKGFDPLEVVPGNGLANIERRVTGLGGQFSLSRRQDSMTLAARFPLAAAAPGAPEAPA